MATRKQKAAMKKLIENNGKSVSQAMKEAGYSKETAKNPQQVTRSLGWKELMDKYLPDKELNKVHKNLLHRTILKEKDFKDSYDDAEIKKIIKGIKGSKLLSLKRLQKENGEGFYKRAIYTITKDGIAQGGLDLAYKLKGKYKEKEDESRHTLKLTDEQLDRLIAR